MNCEALNQQDEERFMQSLGLLGKQYGFGEKKSVRNNFQILDFVQKKKVSDDER